MRVSRLALCTTLPWLALAAAAQANEGLPNPEPQLETGDDEAIASPQATPARVAAIPVAVQPAIVPDPPEFSETAALPPVQTEAAALTAVTPEPAITAVSQPTVDLTEKSWSGPIAETSAEPVAIAATAPIEIAAADEIIIPVIPAPEATTSQNKPQETFQHPSPSQPDAETTVEFAVPEDYSVTPGTKVCATAGPSQAMGKATTPRDLVRLAQRAAAARCYEPEKIETVEGPNNRDYAASPALSIYIPVGYGADRNTAFVSTNYQSAVRPDATGSTFNGGLGVGLGNASKSVGAEISYAFANNDDFGEGGFNVKLHRRLPDDWAIAAGWNGLVNIGRNDFEHSKYGALTKVVRLRPSLDDSFSRLSITAGLGDNQFRSNGAVSAGDNNINVFGNMALRVARPVSLIAEWTGQDLGLGLSIAPIKRFPLTITPAVRDIVTTDGRSARFVLGVGTAFRF
ncbi:MAG: hypothetical protein ACPGVO_12605 [Spirulinaceae cyanobacterium]